MFTCKDISDALQEGRIIFYLQLVVNFDAEASFLEALVRMRGRGDTVYSPAEFLGVAETCGLLSQIDLRAIDYALQFLQENAGLRISINISRQSFAAPGFLQIVEERLDAAQVNLEHLIFEVSEEVTLEERDSVWVFADAVKRRGCLVALDDVGGVDGPEGDVWLLFLLDGLKVDFIKTDRWLVHRPESIKEIAQIAREVGAKLVVEGVEDEATLQCLRDLRVDLVQGYYLSRPLASV